MSRYSAGTIKAALDRVAAVVFASVVGAMATMVGHGGLCLENERVMWVKQRVGGVSWQMSESGN